MISTIERVLFLKSVDLFEQTPSEQLASVAQLAHERCFAKGERLIAEGEEAASLYLIIEGQVRITHKGELVAILGAGECVGEMSLLDSAPRSATVHAQSEVLALCLDQEPFFELLAERAELALSIIALLTRRLRAMVQRTRPNAQELAVTRTLDLPR